MIILPVNSIKYMSILLLCVILLKYNRDTMLLDLKSINKGLYSKVLFRAILFKHFGCLRENLYIDVLLFIVQIIYTITININKVLLLITTYSTDLLIRF